MAISVYAKTIYIEVSSKQNSLLSSVRAKTFYIHFSTLIITGSLQFTLFPIYPTYLVLLNTPNAKEVASPESLVELRHVFRLS